MSARTGTQSIDRAAELLVHVVESGEPTSVGELAETTGPAEVDDLPARRRARASGSRPARRPRQHPARARCCSASPAATTSPTSSTLAGDTLDRLAAASGETVNLGVSTPLGVDQLDQRDGRHFIGSTNWVGRQVPLHCTAQGKVFLAYGTAVLPERPLERHAPRTIVEPRRACG